VINIIKNILIVGLLLSVAGVWAQAPAPGFPEQSVIGSQTDSGSMNQRQTAQLEQKCFDDVSNAIRYAYIGLNKKNFVFLLKQNGQTYYMLFLSKETEAGTNPWRLIERQGENQTSCLVGAGDSIEKLMNFQQSNFPGKFGMPGSGFPRCSNVTEGLPGSALVRFWANRELGKSTVIVLNTNIGQKNFNFLLSRDNHWILIDIDRNNVNLACYYSRGEAASVYEDFVFK
jgi:hypothetical protein